MTRTRLVTALCLTASAVVLFTCDPASAAIYPICPFHWLTGLCCPVCGSIRGMHALLHGHVLDAMRCNVLMIGAVGYAGAVAFRRRRTPPGLSAWPPRARAFAFLTIALAFTVVRNVPGGIGALLRP